MTWGELKRATLEKLDGPDEESLPDLTEQMKNACNEGMNLLCQAGKLILRSVMVTAQQGQVIAMKEQAERYWETDSVFYEETEGWKRTQRYERIGREYLKAERGGNYLIFYYAAPKQIDNTWQETAQIEMPQEAAVLLPLYMASQIYKHDNPQLAAMWRNEFEEGRAELKERAAQWGGFAEIRGRTDE